MNTSKTEPCECFALNEDESEVYIRDTIYCNMHKNITGTPKITIRSRVREDVEKVIPGENWKVISLETRGNYVG